MAKKCDRKGIDIIENFSKESANKSPLEGIERLDLMPAGKTMHYKSDLIEYCRFDRILPARFA